MAIDVGFILILVVGLCHCKNAIVTSENSLEKTTSTVDLKVDEIMNTIQGICVTNKRGQTLTELKINTQALLDNCAKYKEIVKMNQQLKDELQWIIKESNGPKEVSKIINLLQKDVKEVCQAPKPKDCGEVKQTDSGVYTIYPDGFNPVKVQCDMSTDNGGWTVIQKRFDGSVDFLRNWTEYENGFGDVNGGEIWIGNRILHLLTSTGKYELRIDLVDNAKNTKFAVYKTFAVNDAWSKYKLTVGGYSGNAGDKLTEGNEMEFSTIDQDNDKIATGNCASKLGAWWHAGCSASLNGPFSDKMFWTGGNIYLRSKMMIKRL